MARPFQEILKELEVIDDIEYVLLVFLAMGMQISRRRETAATGSQALWRAVMISLGKTPVSALTMMRGARLLDCRPGEQHQQCALRNQSPHLEGISVPFPQQVLNEAGLYEAVEWCSIA